MLWASFWLRKLWNRTVKHRKGASLWPQALELAPSLLRDDIEVGSGSESGSGSGLGLGLGSGLFSPVLGD